MKILRYTWRIGGFLVGCVVVLLFLVVCYRLLVVERMSEDERLPPAVATLTTAAGDEISYRIWQGSSDEVVALVGGLAAWSGTWEETVYEQRQRGSQATFVAIDLPPFGFSRVMGADYSRPAQAARIVAVLTQVARSSRVTMVGHSYGGGPAAEAVLTRPELFSRLVLVSPVLAIGAEAPGNTPAAFAYRPLRTSLTAVALSIEPLLLSRLRSFVYVQDHISYDLLRTYTAPLRTDGRSARLGDWLAAYLTDPLHTYVSTQPAAWASSSVPVTLLWGEQDTLTPPSLASAVTAVHPEAVVRPLVNMGHIPMIEDIPQFNDELARVLDGEGGDDTVQ